MNEAAELLNTSVDDAKITLSLIVNRDPIAAKTLALSTIKLIAPGTHKSRLSMLNTIVRKADKMVKAKK